jgi:hypothetical protein
MEYYGEHRSQSRKIFERALSRKEAPARVDPELFFDMISGLLINSTFGDRSQSKVDYRGIFEPLLAGKSKSRHARS